MKKNVEWLKEQVEKDILHVFAEGDIYYVSREHILGLIDQLDEPEVLSDKWIDEHAKAVTYDGIPDQTEIVYVDDLQTLLVPKQEKLTDEQIARKVERAYEDGYKKGEQHTFYKGYLEGLGDKGSEPETVADVIADFYKSLERFKEVLGTKVEELEE